MVVAKPIGKWKMVGCGHGHVAKVIRLATKATMGRMKKENWSKCIILV